jgi:hypothetical protein
MQTSSIGNQHFGSMNVTSAKMGRANNLPLKSGVIELNGAKIHINQNDSLQTIAKKINANKHRTGVSASIAKTSRGEKVVLTLNRSVINILDPNKVLHELVKKNQLGTNDSCLVQVKKNGGGKVKINYSQAKAPAPVNKNNDLVTKANRIIESFKNKGILGATFNELDAPENEGVELDVGGDPVIIAPALPKMDFLEARAEMVELDFVQDDPLIEKFEPVKPSAVHFEIPASTIDISEAPLKALEEIKAVVVEAKEAFKVISSVKERVMKNSKPRTALKNQVTRFNNLNKHKDQLIGLRKSIDAKLAGATEKGNVFGDAEGINKIQLSLAELKAIDTQASEALELSLSLYANARKDVIESSNKELRKTNKISRSIGLTHTFLSVSGSDIAKLSAVIQTCDEESTAKEVFNKANELCKQSEEEYKGLVTQVEALKVQAFAAQELAKSTNLEEVVKASKEASQKLAEAEAKKIEMENLLAKSKTTRDAVKNQHVDISYSESTCRNVVGSAIDLALLRCIGSYSIEEDHRGSLIDSLHKVIKQKKFSDEALLPMIMEVKSRSGISPDNICGKLADLLNDAADTSMWNGTYSLSPESIANVASRLDRSLSANRINAVL